MKITTTEDLHFTNELVLPAGTYAVHHRCPRGYVITETNDLGHRLCVPFKDAR